MALGIFAFSGVMGLEETYQFKVKTIHIINEVKDHTTEVILNQGAPGIAIEVPGSERTVTTKGDGIVISQISLILRDQMGKLEYFDKKEVDMMNQEVELDMGQGVKVTLEKVGPAIVNITVSRK